LHDRQPCPSPCPYSKHSTSPSKASIGANQVKGCADCAPRSLALPLVDLLNRLDGTVTLRSWPTASLRYRPVSNTSEPDSPTSTSTSFASRNLNGRSQCLECTVGVIAGTSAGAWRNNGNTTGDAMSSLAESRNEHERRMRKHVRKPTFDSGLRLVERCIHPCG